MKNLFKRPQNKEAEYEEQFDEDVYYEGEVYEDEEYAEESYTDEAYAEESYTEEAYAEESYTEEAYAEEDIEEECADEAYAEEDIEEEYADEAYVEEDYAEDTEEDTEEDEVEEDAEEDRVEEDYAEGDYPEEEYDPEAYVDDEEDVSAEDEPEHADGDAYYDEFSDEYTDEYDDVYPEDGYDAEEGADEENKKGGILVWLSELTLMDKLMYGSGAAILLLAIIIGVVFLHGNSSGGDEFADVAAKLDGIEVIGDEGLLAVADAALAKKQVMEIVDGEKEPTTYTEVAYNKDVTVTLKMVSVQKDLKIKFVNKSSGKLIANVPFSVTVTTPDKKTESWSDDDMDGIIYKKGITPGNYKVAVNALTDTKYSSYTLPVGEETVEVRKDIAYKKIDVSDEVKTESEINVATEEQKKQEPAVESSLTDTVEWVPSTSSSSTYVEVGKGSITDPLTISMAGNFLRMAKEVTMSQTSATLKEGDTLKLSVSYELDDVTEFGWGTSDSAVAEVDADGTVTAIAAGTAKITCTVKAEVEKDGETKEVSYEAVCTVTVSAPTPAGSISVKPASVSVSEDREETAQISVSGFASGKSLTYSAESSNDGVAQATVDNKGKVTISGIASGTATITVSANYADEPVQNPPTATISVTVVGEGEFALDKTSVTVYVGVPVEIKANTDDTGISLSAKSSDTKVATAEVSKKTITITGVSAGTAKITVTSSDGDSKTCAVTVKQHPKDDNTTPLKDNSGNQLYVQESDGNYRTAVYADYYKDGVKFFKKGDGKYTGWQTIDGKVYFFDKNGNKVTGEQVIQGAKYNFASDGSLVTGSGTMGIDVSKHNATIDWNAVKNSGVSYVIIRCGYRGYTQGSLVIDPKFAQNIQGATSAGLKVGVYFFSQAVDEVEAVQEASFVLDAVKGYKISYPIFLDVEYSGAAGNKGRADGLDKATRTAVCKAFCATIQSGGYTAGVYANKNWLETKLDPGQLGAYKIWLAQYAATPTYGGRYDMWQYKSTGKVSGITGNVDMNISYLGY